MALQLPASATSPQDIGALIVDMRAYLKWYTHNAIKAKVQASRGASLPVVADMTLELIKLNGGGSTMTGQNLEALIAELEHLKDTAPTMTITLAAAPNTSLKATIVTWCRSNVAPDALVSFRYNRTLLGGMIVRYGSHVFDWSWRRTLLEATDRFPEALRRV